ncbi:MAG TPA: ribbon-helix-helix protein, CopG family [Acidisarcina sp.]|nr:ribbon-helix-helix protein, CopG family [Acidisarcina sp.]
MKQAPPKTSKKGRPQAQTVCLRVQPQQLEDLDRLADRAGTTRSSLIQLAIARLLEKGL